MTTRSLTGRRLLYHNRKRQLWLRPLQTNGIKCPNNSETKTSKVVWKSIVAAKIIEKGSVFTEENLTVKRTGEGIPASFWDMVVGKKANQTFIKDEVISIES